MTLEMNRLCRICLGENDDKDMIHIFMPTETNNVNEVPLYTKFISCCQVEASSSDNLPHKICSKCAYDLNVAYALRELSWSSDITLRSYAKIREDFRQKEEMLLMSDPPKLIPIVSPTQLSPVQESVKTLPKKAAPRKNARKKKVSSAEQETREKEYICPECGKSFIFMCLLKEHLVAHTGDRPFLCSVCGKSYGHQTSLSNHMKIHNADKDFKCDMCTLSFHRRAHLTLHKRTHTGEKPYACNYCDKSFAQSSYLKEHIRVHSGEKPFVCETCGHGFARKSCLVMHRRTHTGELPYPCPECSRSFSQRSQRKRHVLRSHKGSSALRENGELILREHDQLRAMLSKMKSDANDIPIEVYPGQSVIYHNSLVVGLPS